MRECGEECEVYSRVTGYYRPVSAWNKGKREEFKERKTFEANRLTNPCKKSENCNNGGNCSCCVTAKQEM